MIVDLGSHNLLLWIASAVTERKREYAQIPLTSICCGSVVDRCTATIHDVQQAVKNKSTASGRVKML